MKITSPAFGENQRIPEKYTCDGANISPPLDFLEIPENAKSLVLIVDDPDAPMGNFTHWIVYNIPPKPGEVPEDTVPEGGIEGNNDTDSPGYTGPCPPSGEHHYYFRLYALDDTLSLIAGVDRNTVDKAMQGHVIDSAELVGVYSRV